MVSLKKLFMILMFLVFGIQMGEHLLKLLCFNSTVVDVGSCINLGVVPIE